MPLYVVSATGFMLTHMMIALSVSLASGRICQTHLFSSAQNIETVIVGRFLNGAFGSTGATMVGGPSGLLVSVCERNSRSFGLCRDDCGYLGNS